MRISYILLSIALLVSTLLSPTQAYESIRESMSSHDNFIVADGYGPDRWGCSFRDSQVHESSAGTKITTGKGSDFEDLGYGVYSIDMVASNVVGQVTSFFLIANEDTGYNTNIGWMNIWHNRKQNPISINLPFDAAEGWHTYSFEWRKKFVAWSVDGHVVLNRSDIATTPPDETSYRLAINSWTQVNKEVNVHWAGNFQYPNNGRTPQAQFRNMRYRP
ncbi:hypothetical protein BGX33_008348 [Mortierella sp. NVP41]|nr:hypothetical protein BGX33_008348 [Mortierella sp. NVP41]